MKKRVILPCKNDTGGYSLCLLVLLFLALAPGIASGEEAAERKAPLFIPMEGYSFISLEEQGLHVPSLGLGLMKGGEDGTKGMYPESNTLPEQHTALKKYGAPELLPLFCELDDLVYGGIPNIRWDRTKTIGRGGGVCDFCFINEKKLPLAQ
jgi:hypothetical protein